MSDDIARWLGAGAVTAGLTAAMFAGAGLATADTNTDTDTSDRASSQSADTETTAADRDTDSAAQHDEPTSDSGHDKPAADVDEPDPDVGEPAADADKPAADADEPAADEPDSTVDDLSETDVADARPARSEHRGPAQAATENADETTAQHPGIAAPDLEVDPDVPAVDPAPPNTPVAPPAEAPVDTPAAEPVAPRYPRATVVDAPAPARATEATPPRTDRPPVDLLGAVVVNLLAGAAKLFDATPVTPPAVMRTAASEPAAVAATGPLLPGALNGVAGVQVGHSRLAIPGDFFGNTVAADWYFPTRADGSVNAQGMIWLQHGFASTNSSTSALARKLAMETNSIVVAPQLWSLGFTFSGGCLSCGATRQAASAAFLDPGRAALITSARAAGYSGSDDELLGDFVLAGHSAGGGFAAAVAADYLTRGDDAQDARLVGVIMFDGVANGARDGTFARQLAALDAAGTPIYQIAAPAQSWNVYGATTNALLRARPGRFTGVVLTGGSHVDAVIGSNAPLDWVMQWVTRWVPAGNTAAAYTLSAGWINDMYIGASPEAPRYGLYAAANQPIIIGRAAAVALPTPLLNQLWLGDRILFSVLDAITGLFGFHILATPVNTGTNGLPGPEEVPASLVL